MSEIKEWQQRIKDNPLLVPEDAKAYELQEYRKANLKLRIELSQVYALTHHWSMEESARTAEREALQSQCDALTLERDTAVAKLAGMTQWMSDGEALMQSTATSRILFKMGAWWENRPWRLRT